MKRLLAPVLAVLALHIPAALAQDKSLQECQRLQQKIERLSQQRKRGGSSAQMDSWRQARRAVEQKFDDGDCHRFREELR